jgi:haloalkane dehalogenase
VAVADVIARHRAAGRELEAAGVQSFVRDAGSGPAVLCMHGVPASSFLYRKGLGELDARGLRGVAFDLPGLGLAARPAGFELTPAMPDRVLSITALNTLVEVEEFKRPWMMVPFAVRGVGEVWLASMRGPAFAQFMYDAGVEDRGAVGRDELAAYVTLLKGSDRGRAFLEIMRGFERTRAKRNLYVATLSDRRRPVQVVWGAKDPALRLETFGEQARAAAGVERIHELPAKHFPQEDQAPAIADLVAQIADASLPDTKDHDTRGFRRAADR